MSQELEECKAQLQATVAAVEESEKAPSGNTCFYDMYQVVCGMHANLTIDFADDSGVNPEVVLGNESHAQRQLKASERVLTKVIREKNDLQDAKTRLDVELKDVRAQLADSVKENKRIRRGIFSKCLNEPL